MKDFESNSFDSFTQIESDWSSKWFYHQVFTRLFVLHQNVRLIDFIRLHFFRISAKTNFHNNFTYVFVKYDWRSLNVLSITLKIIIWQKACSFLIWVFNSSLLYVWKLQFGKFTTPEVVRCFDTIWRVYHLSHSKHSTLLLLFKSDISKSKNEHKIKREI